MPCDLAIQGLGNGATHAMSGIDTAAFCTRRDRVLPGLVNATDIIWTRRSK